MRCSGRRHVPRLRSCSASRRGLWLPSSRSMVLIPTANDVIAFLNAEFEKAKLPYRVEQIAVLPYVNPMWLANWEVPELAGITECEEIIPGARWEVPQRVGPGNPCPQLSSVSLDHRSPPGETPTGCGRDARAPMRRAHCGASVRESDVAPPPRGAPPPPRG